MVRPLMWSPSHTAPPIVCTGTEGKCGDSNDNNTGTSAEKTNHGLSRSRRHSSLGAPWCKNKPPSRPRHALVTAFMQHHRQSQD